jgi:CMP-N-acetylneuraminic acid synthetase
MKYLAIIPARKGSKGIIDKNFRILNSKHLIEYTFDSALESKRLNSIHLSTDDERIITLAKGCGINSFYTRPDYLSDDSSKIIDVVLYHLDWMEANNFILPENIILLQPTSPIRSKGLIDQCIKTYEKLNKSTLVGISECSQHPYEMFTLKEGKLDFVNNTNTRRQEYPNYYFTTGSVYIAKTNYLKSQKRFFDEDSAFHLVTSEEAIDVDTEFDLELASFLLNRIPKD